jgi:membrane protease YdiL (CAAX protease family)
MMHSETNYINNSSKPPWGAWATAGWGVVLLIAFFIFQGFVYAGFATVEAVKNPGLSINEMMKSIGINGFVISVTYCITTPFSIGLIVLCVWLRHGPSVKRYLGLNAVTPRTMLMWLGIVTIFALASDVLTRLLGRPIVPEFMVHVYETVSVAPLLWIALLAAAPLFEEFFFRGFLFEGFQQSQLGPTGTILLTSLGWTVLHLQYGAYELVTIFVLGILFGVARLKTRSIYPPLAMHALFNLFAMVQLVAYFGSV